MTHDELLDMADRAIFQAQPLGRIGWKTLRAIMELHKPVYSDYFASKAEDACGACVTVSYPCPTIQLIEKALG